MEYQIQKHIHKAITGIAFFSILYLLAINVFDENSTLSILFKIDAYTWSAILALSLVNYFLRFLRWDKYISSFPSNGKKLTKTQNFIIYISGFAFTLTPGKAGETVRSFYLSKYNIEYKNSLGAFLSERILDLFVILLISFFALPLLIGNIKLDVWPMLIAILSAMMLFVIVIILYKFNTITKFGFKWVHIGINKIQDIFRASKFLFSRDLFLISLFLGLIAWIAEAFALFLIINHIFPDFDLVFIAMGIYALSILAGTITFLPGGIGGTEASMILLLSLVGVDYISAFAITIICRAATLWFAVILGAVALFFLKDIEK